MTTRRRPQWQSRLVARFYSRPTARLNAGMLERWNAGIVRERRDNDSCGQLSADNPVRIHGGQHSSHDLSNSSISKSQHASIHGIAVAGLLVFAGAIPLRADVRLPHVLGSHMVLQRGRELPFWGWADPGERVSVQVGDGQAVTAEAGQDGRWRLALPPMEAGGPFTVSVAGNNRVVLEDVLVGEVWVCSGQSNMQWTVQSSLNFEEEKAAAQFPHIRHLTIPRIPANLPVEDRDASWAVCSPETVAGFSACAYFFGRELHRELDVPVGVINSSWGGTRIEPWTPPAGFAAVPALADIHRQVMLTDPASQVYKDRLKEFLAQTEQWLAKAGDAMAAETVLEASPTYPAELRPLTHHQNPTTLYNGMIHHLVPVAIQGAIWYQGESNHGEGKLYTEKMKALIGGWREVWGQGDFPFLYVQIAPYHYGSENPYTLAAFWEAQADALSVPGTGMVVTNDIGNVKDIHPKNKQEVGRRLALLALNGTYGRTDVVASGPVFRSMAIEGDTIRLAFDHVGGGLASRDDQPLSWFQIIGRETDFEEAAAVVDGETVVVSAPNVKEPVAVRFAWHKLAEPNLMNKAGLPARPFRAGEVPERDWLALKVPEAKAYSLVYDVDLAEADKEIAYDVDNRTKISGPFDRIAYFLELQKPEGPTQYAYVSMDAFTDDLAKVGVPTLGTKARFQQKVTGMNVVSNVAGIVTGNGLTGGNIEFWPHNYGPPNSAAVPNASAAVWDFGDQPSDPVDGYGCMQVHNHEAKQTIFAFNNWKAKQNANIGIGNSEGKTRDWTFVGNGHTYTVKRLRVLVHPSKP